VDFQNLLKRPGYAQGPGTPGGQLGKKRCPPEFRAERFSIWWKSGGNPGYTSGACTSSAKTRPPCRSTTSADDRHTPEQIARKLREADRLLGEGADIAAAARHLGVSEQTFHRRRAQYFGMKADDTKRLKELERENATLKRLLAASTRRA
jgi:putative transposase